MLEFNVDEKRCTRCGLCVKDCPSRIIERHGKSTPLIRPEKEPECLQCQHCLAVCPTGAISILGRDPAASLKLKSGSWPSREQMTCLIRGRRSVRRYRDENVEPDVIRDLLSTLANAPSGVNSRGLTFTVIDDRKIMQAIRKDVLSGLADADRAGRLPGHFAYLKEAPAAYAADGTDILFRTAPHALVVSASPKAVCPQEDVVLALAYFELLAQSAGLGTVWWGMFRMILAVMPQLKARLGIPADHAYCYAMLFGRPAVTYPRTVQRDDAAVVHKVTG